MVKADIIYISRSQRVAISSSSLISTIQSKRRKLMNNEPSTTRPISSVNPTTHSLFNAIISAPSSMFQSRRHSTTPHHLSPSSSARAFTNKITKHKYRATSFRNLFVSFRKGRVLSGKGKGVLLFRRSSSERENDSEYIPLRETQSTSPTPREPSPTEWYDGGEPYISTVGDPFLTPPAECHSPTKTTTHSSPPLSPMSNGSPSSIRVKKRHRKLKKSQRKAMSLLGPEASRAVRRYIQ